MYTTNNYPTSIQDPVDPIASDNTSAFDHAGLETFQNESIKALKDKVGANGSAVTSSHDYKLSEVTSTDKAVGKTATQTLTNKTLTAPTVNTPTVTDASLSGNTQIDIGSDATGDLLVRKSTGKLGRIAAGTTKQMLVANGTGAEPTYQSLDAVLPTQIGNSGKYLSTNGTTASWEGIAQTLQFTAGENITAGDALHLSDSIQTDGGIKYDNSAANLYTNVTNQTVSFTVGNNSNRLLLVQVVTQAAVTPSSVTYGGVSMALVRAETFASNYKNSIYRLIAPATGTNNIVVTSTAIYAINPYSLYNVDQTTPVEVNAGNATIASSRGASWSSTQSVTNLTKGAIAIGFQQANGGSGTYTGYGYVDSPYYYTPALTTTLTDTIFSSNPSANFAVNIGRTKKIEKLQSTNIFLGNNWTGGGGTAGSIVVVVVKPATAVSVGVVKADCDVSVENEPLINFCGIAKTTATIGNSVDVFTLGSVANTLSGLTAGNNYYLTTTAGTLSTSQPSSTYSVLVGTAKSATELVIRKEKTVGQNIAKDSSYTYTAECDGFIGATATDMYPVQKNQTYTSISFFRPIA